MAKGGLVTTGVVLAQPRLPLKYPGMSLPLVSVALPLPLQSEFTYGVPEGLPVPPRATRPARR